MSSAKAKPTAADRLRRGGSVEQLHSGRTVSGGVRVKPVRITVDLDPSDHDVLRDYAHEARMTQTDVVRALVRLLDDPSVSQQVRNAVSH